MLTSLFVLANGIVLNRSNGLIIQYLIACLIIVTRNGYSGNTAHLNRNLYVMLKLNEWPKTPGMTSKKTMLSLKEISSFAGDFALIWMNQRVIWFNLQRDGTVNGLSNVKETFSKDLQLKMSALCTKVWAFPKLVSQVYVMAGQNKCKEKVLDVSDPNQNLETTCNSKLKFTWLKDLFIKMVQKN